jgi:hypothetical protein
VLEVLVSETRLKGDEMNPEDRIKKIEKEITKVSIIDSPGSIMVGLGLYAKFSANGDAFHPILNNESIVNVMLTLGAAIMVWGGYKIFTLTREKASLKNKYNL